MTVRIAPELEAEVQEKAKEGGLSVEAYLERLIHEDEGWSESTETPLTEDDPEFADILMAVDEGLAQAERGEGRAAEDVLAELRAKHGFSR